MLTRHMNSCLPAHRWLVNKITVKFLKKDIRGSQVLVKASVSSFHECGWSLTNTDDSTILWMGIFGRDHGGRKGQKTYESEEENRERRKYVCRVNARRSTGSSHGGRGGEEKDFDSGSLFIEHSMTCHQTWHSCDLGIKLQASRLVT